MKRVLKWVGISIGGLVGLLVVLVVVLIVLGTTLRLNKTYDIEVAAIPIPTDAESIARGRHIAESYGLCVECHGDDLGGDILAEDALFGKLAPSNLTTGLGGKGGEYTDLTFVRAIRHGIGSDGKPLVIMPSQYFYKFSDDDVGAIVAYLKSLPPVDNEDADTSLGPLGRIISLFDSEILAARIIDHEATRPATPPVGVTKEYGEYLTTLCSVCHGEHLSGGEVPDPDSPLAPNLTLLTRARWSEQDFFTALRTGVKRSGKQLDNEFMPWESLGKMTDDELGAIWLFLSSLETRRFGK